jgi:hypothetical protein
MITGPTINKRPISAPAGAVNFHTSAPRIAEVTPMRISTPPGPASFSAPA